VRTGTLDNPTIKIIPGPERKLFYAQQERGPISTVQGRDHDDVICLYARIRPIVRTRAAALSYPARANAPAAAQSL
jgi:hypothetical protein